MPVGLYIGLILCNLIWSLHPVMGKWVLADLPVLQVAWIRYSSALVGYWVAIELYRIWKPQARKSHPFLFFPKANIDKVTLVLLGVLTFCVAPMLQTIGLSLCMATENSVLIALEPLLTAFLALLFLGEKMGIVLGASFALALLGFAFLSGVTSQNWTSGNLDTHFIGNLLIFLSLFGEASFSVLGRRLATRYPPAALFGTALASGVFFLTLVVLGQSLGWRGPILSPGLLSLKGWFAVFWFGPLGTGLCYFFAMHALTRISATTLGLTLFLQPVAGAFWGFLFLGDRLTWIQQLGVSLILIAIILPLAASQKKKRRVQNTS